MSEWTIHDEVYWSPEQKAEYEKQQLFARREEQFQAGAVTGAIPDGLLIARNDVPNVAM
jgi:hypothetical protein